MKKVFILRSLIVLGGLSLAFSAYSQTQEMKEAISRAREQGKFGEVIDGKDAVDRAYERTLKKKRIKELLRNGVSIEKGNSGKRAASSSGIGGSGRSKVRYNNSSSSYGESSSNVSSSNREVTPIPYAAEAQRNLNTWNEIDSKMQRRMEEARNWKPSKSVNDMIANSRDGVKGNRDDGVEPDPVKPKGIKVNPLEGIIDDAEPEKEELSEYDQRMLEYLEQFENDESSLSDEQLDELEAYLISKKQK